MHTNAYDTADERRPREYYIRNGIGWLRNSLEVVRVFELRGYQKHQDQKDQRLSRIGSGVSLYSPEESGVEDASFDKFCGVDDPSSSKDMFPISIISSNADLSAEKVTASIISVESTNQHNLTCTNI